MKLKRVFAVLLCVAMMFSAISTVSAKTLADFLPIDTTDGEKVAVYYEIL